jgi:putative membrane protein
MELIIKLLINAVAIMGAAYLLRGVTVRSFGAALITALLLAVANAFVKPLLVLLGFPIVILTVGLFLLVINGAVVWLVSALFSGFKVASFGWAIGFSVLLWLLNMVLYGVFI